MSYDTHLSCCPCHPPPEYGIPVTTESIITRLRYRESEFRIVRTEALVGALILLTYIETLRCTNPRHRAKTQRKQARKLSETIRAELARRTVHDVGDRLTCQSS